MLAKSRGFLGWLRGERGHCSMARVPTIAEEDAKRPNRERECLVGERTRIVNRIKRPWPGWAFATSNQPGAGLPPRRRGAVERLATVPHPGGHAAAAKCPGRAAARSGQRRWDESIAQLARLAREPTSPPARQNFRRPDRGGQVRS